MPSSSQLNNGSDQILQALERGKCIGVYVGQRVWQSRVEIEGHSIVYFDHIAAFEALYC